MPCGSQMWRLALVALAKSTKRADDQVRDVIDQGSSQSARSCFKSLNAFPVDGFLRVNGNINAGDLS